MWSVTLLVFGLLLRLSPALTQAQGSNRAGLVVKFGDGRVVTRCIEFGESELTGEQVLDRAGLSLVKDYSSGLGAAICKIEGQGCDYPAEHCFCQCMGDGCQYWAYFHLRSDGSWKYSGMGSTSHTVHNGEVEGWAWGNGEAGGSEVEPPRLSFDDVCQPISPPADTPTSPPPIDNPGPSPVSGPREVGESDTTVSQPESSQSDSSSAPKPSISFLADSTQVEAGQCTTLRWDVENAQAIYLDGQGVTGHEARNVCPPQTQTYELRVVSPHGESSRQVSIEVIAPTPTDTPLPTATPLPTSTPAPATTSLPTSAPLPTATPPPTSTPAPPTDTPAPPPGPSPTAVAMVVTAALTPLPPAAPIEKGPSSEEEARRVTWLVILSGIAVGTVGLGGLAFVTALIVLGFVYFYFRRRTAWTDDDSRGY